LTDESKAEVFEIYGYENVYILEEAYCPDSPSNVNHTQDIMTSTAIGALISVITVFFVYYFDTTVKKAEDIENKLGMSVMAVILFDDGMEGEKRK